VVWDNALEMQLCYEIKTFLLAGHETSAAMLTWSCFELSLDPHVLSQASACFHVRTCALANKSSALMLAHTSARCFKAGPGT